MALLFGQVGSVAVPVGAGAKDDARRSYSLNVEQTNSELEVLDVNAFDRLGICRFPCR